MSPNMFPPLTRGERPDRAAIRRALHLIFFRWDLRKDSHSLGFCSFHEGERERGEKRLILCSLVVDFRGPDYPEVQVLESDFPYILCLEAIPTQPWV